MVSKCREADALGYGLGHCEEEVQLLCSRVSGPRERQIKYIFTGDGESDKRRREVWAVADPGVNKKECCKKFSKEQEEGRRSETLTLEVLWWRRKRGPKGIQHSEVPVVSCLEAMGKTNGQAASGEISCYILGRALIIKQKSAPCGPFSVKALRT